MMMRCRYGSNTGFLGVLAPSMSIKDRSVVGSADRGLNCTNRMPVTGKPSTALLRKYRTSTHLMG